MALLFMPRSIPLWTESNFYTITFPSTLCFAFIIISRGLITYLITAIFQTRDQHGFYVLRSNFFIFSFILILCLSFDLIVDTKKKSYEAEPTLICISIYICTTFFPHNATILYWILYFFCFSHYIFLSFCYSKYAVKLYFFYSCNSSYIKKPLQSILREYFSISNISWSVRVNINEACKERMTIKF